MLEKHSISDFLSLLRPLLIAFNLVFVDTTAILQEGKGPQLGCRLKGSRVPLQEYPTRWIPSFSGDSPDLRQPSTTPRTRPQMLSWEFLTIGQLLVVPSFPQPRTNRFPHPAHSLKSLQIWPTEPRHRHRPSGRGKTLKTASGRRKSRQSYRTSGHKRWKRPKSPSRCRATIKPEIWGWS